MNKPLGAVGGLIAFMLPIFTLAEVAKKNPMSLVATASPSPSLGHLTELSKPMSATFLADLRGFLAKDYKGSFSSHPGIKEITSSQTPSPSLLQALGPLAQTLAKEGWRHGVGDVDLLAGAQDPKTLSCAFDRAFPTAMQNALAEMEARALAAAQAAGALSDGRDAFLKNASADLTAYSLYGEATQARAASLAAQLKNGRLIRKAQKLARALQAQCASQRSQGEAERDNSNNLSRIATILGRPLKSFHRMDRAYDEIDRRLSMDLNNRRLYDRLMGSKENGKALMSGGVLSAFAGVSGLFATWAPNGDPGPGQILLGGLATGAALLSLGAFIYFKTAIQIRRLRSKR